MADVECKHGAHTADCHGRMTCTLKVRCPDCGWVGYVRDANHDYIPSGDGDVEPWDFCPSCSNEWLVDAT